MVDLFRLNVHGLTPVPRKGMVMRTQTELDLAAKYPRGVEIVRGKTKAVIRITSSVDLAALVSADDITAGDGAKHDVMLGKGQLSNQTTCNVFRLLNACGIHTAFVEQDSPNSFVATLCKMLPYEVVVRREAHGSYCKRNPHIPKGHVFPKLVVEFFLKTSGRKWKTHELPCDDPLMLFDRDGATGVMLYNPAKPIHGQEPFLVLHTGEVFTASEEWRRFGEMARIAVQAFLVLEKAWQLLRGKLVDFKVEFGLDRKGKLLLADVVDNDSWRVLDDEGTHLDKQTYRDGDELGSVFAKYRQVAEVTNRFGLPRQRLLFWRGSGSDSMEPFIEALEGLGVLPSQRVDAITVTCSAHKEPMRAVTTLLASLQDVPDSVVVAYVGMSNAAGPILSAVSTTPVITVPANVGVFPDDVWASLRAPRDVPVMTVLSPANAVLAASNILAMRNPFLYMVLRQRLEERLANTVPI